MAKKTPSQSAKTKKPKKVEKSEKLTKLVKTSKPIKKAIEKAIDESKKKKSAAVNSERIEYPKNLTEYHNRLVTQKKEIWKTPVVLPPDFPNLVKIEAEKQPLPKRAKNGDLIFADHKEFVPNHTPEEVLRGGSFGGTYFRPITSAVTNISYKSADVLASTVQPEWIKGLPANMLTSSTYRTEINKFGAKCGGSLGMWESSGWMTDADPYGWFQWYCRFYQGRRCSDDAR